MQSDGCKSNNRIDTRFKSDNFLYQNSIATKIATKAKKGTLLAEKQQLYKDRRMTTPFSHAITITGATCVGTTTTLKNLSMLFAKDKRMRFISAGDIMRLYADKEKMGIDGFVADEKLHEARGFDEKCDAEVQAFGEQNYTIIDGRLPHAFVPRAFHVLQTCPLELRAQRLHKNPRLNKDNLSMEEARDLILRRDENDRRRWDRIYVGHNWPESDFDLVVSSIANEIDLMRTIEIVWTEWVRRLSTTHGYRTCWTVR